MAMAQIRDPALMSRILYSNPVCLLTTTNGESRNVMTVSWLTPTDNNGNIFLSMNMKRFSSSLVYPGSTFVLNIPVAGMEALVLAIGKSSGRETDKFSEFNIQICKPGWILEENVVAEFSSDSSKVNDPIAICDCAAHLVCRTTSMNKSDHFIDDEREHKSKKRKNTDSHYFITATIEEAFVRTEYWDGKRFVSTSNGVPPTLTFLGSGAFAYMRQE